MAALGAAAGASVPAAPRRAATFDGRIRVVAASGNTIYIGGNFNCAGTALTRHKLLSVDEASGRLTGWNPGANSPLGVFGLTAAGGTLAAGGDFTRVAGVARGRFALFG